MNTRRRESDGRTFHEDGEDVPQDGHRGPKDEEGEEEGADGIRYFILRLGRKHAEQKTTKLKYRIF